MKRLPLILGLIWLSGCASAPKTVAPPPPRLYAPGTVGPMISGLMPEPFSDTRSVEVLYGTNRLPGADQGECDDNAFGVNPTGKTAYGSCMINVPKRHRIGELGLADNPRSDPHQYFRALNHTPMTPEALAAKLTQSKATDALVFIHGFNVRFGEAVVRAAQIAYDLKFQGPVVIFTWPAGSNSTVDSTMITRTYEANKASARVSVGQAAGFFKVLASVPGLRIHLMVHSMGHQVALPALARAAPEIGRPFLGEVVLNAPDFPVKDLPAVIPPIRAAAQRITVYCSFNDNAIAASEVWNKGRRLGACEQIPGADVINAGEIDVPPVGGLGHSYYAARAVLTDVFQLMLGLDAERRLFIRKSEPNSVENYYLRP